MKVAIAFLALIALSFSAPQPRKLFHEHYEDFTDLIMKEAGHDLDHLLEHYLEFEEFQVSIDYLQTSNFRNLVYEMEDLPEFKAVVAFLEGHEIDINYFVEAVNAAVDSVQRRGIRHTLSGRDMSSFIKDCISEFPKQKLIALNAQKVAEDEQFKRAMESFYSEEWQQVFGALFENETFIKEIAALDENGINVHALLAELKAIMGVFDA